MIVRLTGFARRLLAAVAYSAGGAAVTLLVVGVLYMESRPDLDVWHTAALDEEFTETSRVASFADYLALEERLFAQLHAQVYAKIPADERRLINRYSHHSLSDPESQSPNWNRSFELAAAMPEAGVLLLHGMSDSPYSLRALGETLHAAGATVVGMRMPGHGTAPSGLVEISWQDMAAAVCLAMRHLATRVGERPLYIVGYSTGAALAVNYALATLDEGGLPKVDGMVLLSPAIGVSAAAAFAVWQGRIGHFLGLEKLAWTSILPEYDPYKYGSFAVNAGDVVYRLTQQIQSRLDVLGGRGKLAGFPPLLAFSSVVDATVSAPALVSNLFDRLPQGGHELVLFDLNRMAEMDVIMTSDPAGAVKALLENPVRPFALSLVTNENSESRKLRVLSEGPGDSTLTESPLDLAWPPGIYSLAHVALPFPPDDPIYGGKAPSEARVIHLGKLALRGERGVLQIPAADMLRLRWNPFFPYVEARVLAFTGLGRIEE
ncbi:MAG: alpha/beta fold hydrolase [Candidatus Accumulibacter meliphilus]|jgi:alpha-beta hydrolase superfamily lysophospholipase|uniref:Alpha/beta fold hydrolase n=1 Tax=Candidatus Accumulibacter meliphilus TaxID=2211374 RepID=A0A369XKH2_9PROT|nr:MAG: alpha/beta fold hydrolase [Candidatus Accumulibacter meliphilus]